MSISGVMALLANLCESPRISKGRDSQNKTVQANDLQRSCETRESQSLSYMCAGAHAHARARGAEVGAGDSQVSRDSHRAPSLKVTVLKHCRCQDCRKFSREGKDYFCSEYIGGTAVVWATRRRFCDPLPDAWHYCACYHGPQISKDVWVWPRHGSAEVTKVAAGPSGGSAAEYRGGNGSEGCVFRLPAHAQGKEA